MDIRTIFIIGLSILLAATIAVSGYLYWLLEKKPQPIPVPNLASLSQPVQSSSDVSERIDLYYLTPDQSQFIVDKRLTIRSETITERIHKALDELLNTKKTPSNLIAPIPYGTQLQSVYWNEMDGRVYVSFSKEILDNNPGHALSEWATIYCIVNTVAAQSATVKEVQILIDGETIHNAYANWDWSHPFQPDHTFVRYQTGSGGDSNTP